METLRSYLATMPPAEQAAYAVRAGTTIGYLRKAMSKRQRFDGALARRLDEESRGEVLRYDLRPDVFGLPPGTDRAAVPEGPAITKRALMDRLAFASDTSLAVFLDLPREAVEGWADDHVVPMTAAVQLLLTPPADPQKRAAPADPDDDRIVPVEVA